MLPVNSAADFLVFLKFSTWFGHVAADALKVEGHAVNGQGDGMKTRSITS